METCEKYEVDIGLAVVNKLCYKYSSDNMLFKLFLKNTQKELLLTRCY